VAERNAARQVLGICFVGRAAAVKKERRERSDESTKPAGLSKHVGGRKHRPCRYIRALLSARCFRYLQHHRPRRVDRARGLSVALIDGRGRGSRWILAKPSWRRKLRDVTRARALRNLLAAPGHVRVGKRTISVTLLPAANANELRAFDLLLDVISRANLSLPSDPHRRRLRFRSQIS
jgi:hypothetical protein